VTEDGQPYELSGKLLFSDLSVDPSSGAVTLRAEFPNPNKMLLPGQYVRAKLEQGVQTNAITVPQQALQRDPSGASVLVVGADNKVAVQPVKTGGAQGSTWIITDGLKAGDRVIVEGFQKVKPGAPVKAVQWNASPANGGPAVQAESQNAASTNAKVSQADKKTKAD
jgi:membrane fusion protein (multidrug efflux system)